MGRSSDTTYSSSSDALDDFDIQKVTKGKMFRLMLLSTLAILAQIPENTYAGNADPTALGCWKDDIPRALPSLEGKSTILSEHYTVRENPIQKCELAAAAKGFTTFAVQDGGQCFSSADAKTKVKTHGSSTACSSGKGGPMANSAYEISLLKKCLCVIPAKHQNALPKGKPCFDSVTATNEIKRTALHVASKNGHHLCTMALITAGAKVDALDKDNSSALKLAQWKSNAHGCDSVKALVAAKAKTDGLNKVEKARVQLCIQES